MKSWKALEYRVAEYFGGKRRRQYKYYLQGPDVNQPYADLEVKLRKQLPKWIKQYLKKCKSWSKSKLAAVLFYERGSEDAADGIAVMSTSDLKLLLEAFRETPPGQPSHQLPSEPASPKRTRSRWTPKGRRKSRWKSRRRKSRK